MPASAQEWTEYTSRSDLFTVNFPAEPTVREISYSTEYGVTLPGHVYSYQDGPNRYAVSVIDYSNIEKLHAQRLANYLGHGLVYQRLAEQARQALTAPVSTGPAAKNP